MKTKSLLIIFILFTFFQVKAQSTRYEFFYLVKYKEPLIKNLEVESNPTICFIAKNYHKIEESINFYGLTSNTDNAGYYNYNFKHKNFKINLSYPNYTSEVHFNSDNQIIAFHKKTQNSELGEINSVKYTCNLSAIQYITDLNSKIVYKRDIILKKSDNLDEKEFFNIIKQKVNDDVKNEDMSYNASVSIPSVSDDNLEKYIKKGSTKREDYTSIVYEEQAKRIYRNAEDFIKKAFFKQPYKEKLSFYYIKKFNNFDIVPFNNAYEDVKTYFNSEKNDSTLLTNAVFTWKKEIRKLNLNNKNEKSLFLEGIQNIVKTYYVLKNQDSIKKYVQIGKEYGSEPNYLEKFITIKSEPIQEYNNNLIKLESIPSTLLATIKFSNKSPNKINEINSFISNDIQNIINLFLIKDLTNDSDSHYYEEIIFTTLKNIKIDSFINKKYPNVADALEKYKREVKNLYSKENGMAEFFDKYNISDINKNITYESLNAYFDDSFKKINSENISLIRSIITLNSSIHILINHNLKTEQYNVALKDVKEKTEKYFNSLQEPKPEIIQEVLNNFKLIEVPNNTISLSLIEINNIKENLKKLASLLYPY